MTGTSKGEDGQFGPKQGSSSRGNPGPCSGADDCSDGRAGPDSGRTLIRTSCPHDAWTGVASNQKASITPSATAPRRAAFGPKVVAVNLFTNQTAPKKAWRSTATYIFNRRRAEEQEA